MALKLTPQQTRLALALGILVGVELASSWAVADPTYTLLTVPEAKKTAPSSLNSAGDVAGMYKLRGGNLTGFVRSTDGSLISFLCPDQNEITNAFVSDAGTVGGTCAMQSSVGYLRAADGSIVTFQVSGHPTIAFGANAAGDLTGSYIVTGPFAGFVRYTDGSIDTFSISGGNSSTTPVAINAQDEVAGIYYNDDMTTHGFYRLKSGKLKVFDAPGAGVGFSHGTFVTAINAKGVIAGNLVDSHGISHGFILKKGKFTIFDADRVASINDKGDVTGTLTIGVGMVRSAKGEVTTFEAPGCSGTNPSVINNSGVVLGNCYVPHRHGNFTVGFLRFP